MAAALKIGLSIEGWMRKSRRLKRVVAALPKIRLGYEGTGWNGTSNANIATHALAHGDAIWTMSPGTLGDMAAELRDGLVRVARNEQKDADAEMQELADMAREDIYYNILDGKIDGPSRSQWWNEYKAAHYSAPTPNMVASRQWLDSLTAELVER